MSNSINYLINTIQTLNGNKKDKAVKALIGNIDGTFNHGSRNPTLNYPVWATKDVSYGGFMCGILFKLQKDQNNLDILNNSDELNKYTDLIPYITHNLAGPEPLIIPTIGLLIRNNYLNEANELKTIIEPYLSTLRFYPIQNEILPNPTYPNVFAALESIYKFKLYLSETKSYLEYKLKTFNYLKKKNKLKTELINLFKDTIYNCPIHNKYICCFKTLNNNLVYSKNLPEINNIQCSNKACSWPMQYITNQWIIKANNIIQSNKWYNIDTHKRKRGILYNLWNILVYIIKSTNLNEQTNKLNNLNGKIVMQIRYYLSASIYKNTDNLYNDSNIFETKLLQVNNLFTDLNKLNSNSIDQKLYEIFKSKYDKIPEVIEKLNKSVEYSLDDLKKFNYIPSSETFVELSQPIEAFLQTIDFDFKENITIQEHLKYLIYKAFKNMRSLLLLNLESQLKITEIPHYNILNTIYKKNTESSNKLILVKIITTNYVKWFAADLMPNRVTKMLYNLVNEFDSNVGFCEEIACDIFQRKFSTKYNISLQIAKKYMINTLYSKYYDIDKFYNSSKNLTELSIELKNQYNSSTKSSYIDFNGQQLQASYILTTHNNIQIDKFLDTLDFNNVVKKITLKIFSHLETDFINPNIYLTIGHMWRNLIYYLTKLNKFQIAQYFIWIITKIIWQQLCNNKSGYLNIDNTTPAFIQNVLNKNLQNLSINNKYVEFKNIYSEIKSITSKNIDNIHNILKQFATYTKYLQNNKFNMRVFGLCMQSLLYTYIDYYNITQYNYFNKQDIILGWDINSYNKGFNDNIKINNSYKEFLISCNNIIIN